MKRRIPFLDLFFDPLTVDEAAATIAKRAHGLGPFAYVATPNVDHMVKLEKQPELAPLYDDAWLSLCDSRILEAFASASYIDLPAAPGADVVETLFRSHIAATESVLVIGGSEAMIDKLRKMFGLKNLRWFDAPQGLRDDAAARAACVQAIRDNPSSLVFLAVGAPQQELIAREARMAGDCSGVAICCGASLEFLVGETKRAPKWMRANRLEWLFRLCVEPGRMWQRYLVDGPRIFLIWHRWRTRVYSTSAIGDGMAVSPH
jgi:N-acetylglucosaminyldiphosphoundecaprenol N-acetyl-beta-D-mannosaminyltransferase